jgi:hypothetical protein
MASPSPLLSHKRILSRHQHGSKLYLLHYIFALEPLAGLDPKLVIPHVWVKGVPGWFVECLELRFQGQGSKLAELERGSSSRSRR